MSLPSPDNDLLLSSLGLRVESLTVQYHNHTVAILVLLSPAQINSQLPDVAVTRYWLIYPKTSHNYHHSSLSFTKGMMLFLLHLPSSPELPVTATTSPSTVSASTRNMWWVHRLIVEIEMSLLWKIGLGLWIILWPSFRFENWSLLLLKDL